MYCQQRENTHIYNFFNLLGIHLIPLLRGRRATMPSKKTRKKGQRKTDRGRRGETIHTNPGERCAYGGRRTEQKTKNERNRERAPKLATLDHLVASYDAQGSYGGPILRTPTPPLPKGVFIYLLIYLFIYLFICLVIYLFVYLFSYLFICLVIYLFVYLYINLFIYFTGNYSRHIEVGAHQRQGRREEGKKKEEERSEAQRAKSRTLIPSVDALIGSEE